jgi:hypothetical protein
MNRREFIIRVGVALIALPAAFSFESCGGGGGGDATPAAPAPGFDIASSPDNTGHSHLVRILDADLAAPPAGGVIYTSTGSHTHTVPLTQQQLTDINNGLSVTVISSLGGAPAHTHTWTIAKPPNPVTPA